MTERHFRSIIAVQFQQSLKMKGDCHEKLYNHQENLIYFILLSHHDVGKSLCRSPCRDEDKFCVTVKLFKDYPNRR